MNDKNIKVDFNDLKPGSLLHTVITQIRQKYPFDDNIDNETLYDMYIHFHDYFKYENELLNIIIAHDAH